MDNFNKLIHTGANAGQYEMVNICLAFKVNLCIYILNHNNIDNSKFKFSYETIISAQLYFNNYIPFYSKYTSWMDKFKPLSAVISYKSCHLFTMLIYKYK